MKKLSRRNSLLVTLPLVALAAGYFWFVHLPAKRAVAAMRVELEEKQAYLASASTTEAKIRAVQRELDEARAYIDHWRGDSTRSTESAALFGEVATQLESAGVTATQFTPQPTTPYQTVTKVPLRIVFEGSFPQACEVLEGLEKLPGLVWIDDVTLESEGQEGQVLHCEISLAAFANNSEKSD